jgi:hypothetical protein
MTLSESALLVRTFDLVKPSIDFPSWQEPQDLGGIWAEHAVARQMRMAMESML